MHVHTIIDLLCYSNIEVDVWSIEPSYCTVSKWYLLLIWIRDKPGKSVQYNIINDKSGHELIGFLCAFTIVAFKLCVVFCSFISFLSSRYDQHVQTAVFLLLLQAVCWGSHHSHCCMVCQPRPLCLSSTLFSLFFHFSFCYTHCIVLLHLW